MVPFDQLQAPSLSESRFLVIDFETVTPKGRPAAPIEVAVLPIATGFTVDRAAAFSTFICPPPDSPLTPFDIQQTGIRPSDVAGAPTAEAALMQVDEAFGSFPDALVAHNAPYEAGLLSHFSPACPRLSSLPFIDTVALGRSLLPDLANHKLDTLAAGLAVTTEGDRHRALGDVLLTAAIFIRLAASARADHGWDDLDALLIAAGYPRLKPPPAQQTLFS